MDSFLTEVNWLFRPILWQNGEAGVIPLWGWLLALVFYLMILIKFWCKPRGRR